MLLWSVLTIPILPFARAEFYESLPPTPLDTSTGNVYFLYNITSRRESDDGNNHTYLKLDLAVNASNTFEKRKFVTYAISITPSTDPKATPILTEVFYSENGTLLLDMVHGQPPVTIPGTREQLLNSYVTDPSGKITAKGIPFDNVATYHVTITVLTVDNIRNLFPSSKEPTADFVFSGDMPSVIGQVRATPEFPIVPLALVISVAIVTLVARSCKAVGWK